MPAKKRVTFSHQTTTNARTSNTNNDTNSPQNSTSRIDSSPQESPDRSKKDIRRPCRSCNFCFGGAANLNDDNSNNTNIATMMMEDPDTSSRPPQMPSLNGGGSSHHQHSMGLSSPSAPVSWCGWFSDLSRELVSSSELLFHTKLNWLLILGPFALLGDATGMLGEAVCFAFSGIALIPCAER